MNQNRHITCRQSNFELLRILAAFSILFQHIVADGIGVDHFSSNFIVQFVRNGARMSCNLFLMITAWFLVESTFKASRVIALYAELWFFSVVETILSYCYYSWVGGVNPYSVKAYICGIFPLTNTAVWYVSVHIFLLLTIPFLNYLIKIRQSVFRKLIILGLFIVSGLSTYKQMDTILCCYTWFCFVYLFIAYFRKNLMGKICSVNKWIYLVVGLLVYIFMVCRSMEGSSRAAWYLRDFKSLPNLLCSFLIFIFFLNINIGEIKWINCIAKGTLGIYIAHQIPIARQILMKYIGSVEMDHMVVWAFGCSLLVFVCGYLLDWLWVILLKPVMTRNPIARWVEEKINLWYKDV